MRKLYFVLSLGFFALATAFGNEPNSEPNKEPNNVSVHEVTGQGRNKNEAIKDGLYIAVSQARGIKVGSGSYEFGYFGADVDVNNTQKNSKKIDFDAVSVETSGTAYTTEIGGMVKTYKILEENKLNDGSCSVKLKVWVYGLGSQGESKRLKIAIMPFKAMTNIYYFSDLQVPAEVLSAILSQKVTVALVETNKFNVLDRESIIDFARENNLLLTLDSPLSEQAKLAETSGADYLLIGTISEAKLERKEESLAATGQTVYKHIARFVFNYRLVASTTKQIIFAGVAERYLENEEIRSLSHEWNPENWDSAEIRDGIAAIIANDVAKTILGRLYPIRVASVEGNQVVIDQGGDKIREGMLLDILSQGKEIFDYDTKESLGNIEDLVATVKITKVSQSISFGEVVDGDISKITKGFICRIKDVNKNYDTGMRPDVTRSKSGGVILPFDKK